MPEPIEPEKPAVRCTGVVGDGDERETEATLASLRWRAGKNLRTGMMPTEKETVIWRNGYLAGRRAQDASSPTARIRDEAPRQ